MYYIEEAKNIYKKHEVLFNKEQLGSFLSEIDKNTTIRKHVYSQVQSMEDYYTDDTMFNVEIKKIDKDIYISYDKDFRSRLYNCVYGILQDDEASIYDLLDLYNSFKDRVDLTAEEQNEYNYTLKTLKYIHFHMVSTVNIHSTEQIQRFLEGIHYSRVLNQRHK